jgi:hypothetical protein
MKITEYLRRHSMSVYALSLRCDIMEGTLIKLISCPKRKILRSTALKIVHGTDNEVTLEDLPVRSYVEDLD